MCACKFGCLWGPEMLHMVGLEIPRALETELDPLKKQQALPTPEPSLQSCNQAFERTFKHLNKKHRQLKLLLNRLTGKIELYLATDHRCPTIQSQLSWTFTGTLCGNRNGHFWELEDFRPSLRSLARIYLVCSCFNLCLRIA